MGIRFRNPDAEIKVLTALSKRPLSHRELQKETGLHPNVVSEVLGNFYEVKFALPPPMRGERVSITMWGEIALRMNEELSLNYIMSPKIPPSRGVLVRKIPGSGPFIVSRIKIPDAVIERIHSTTRALREARGKAGEGQIKDVSMALIGEYGLVHAQIFAGCLRNANIEIRRFKSTEEVLQGVLDGKVDLAVLSVPIEAISECRDVGNLLIVPLGYLSSNLVEAGPVGVEVWHSSRTREFQYFPSAQRGRAASVLSKKFDVHFEATAEDEHVLDPCKGLLTARTANAVLLNYIAARNRIKGRKLAYISPLFTVVSSELAQRNPSLLNAIIKAHGHVRSASKTFKYAVHRASILATLSLMKDVANITSRSEYLRRILEKYNVPLHMMSFKGVLEEAESLLSSLGLRIPFKEQD